eukprot:CAMPEP_0177530750 /NCGR_PEP_ID=MMETSP0369-20130122/53592_1 /TAXON_ID=447022 ORGANISM="Scrippsiella hangoei-like, Strain SHHI-4" /NCGR_SAMPLE_ID=MMETSP0369 /ASSEMBLY_ACC=CAM_ASM_000364 /LENGTH=39 /DNA_ID= /DNA_START= /DNA_END= /DNA_ORIENTATION=
MTARAMWDHQWSHPHSSVQGQTGEANRDSSQATVDGMRD